ncbi:MAG: DUF624 domain-containing protein [Oscillospiraceae bacterium]|nr:DUF624 domain-containing protein [Oscillospiraceae bacterium]MBQ8979028.1 DUF624 domain-containing protein [Oscillospiraceae bacterium]
MRFFSEENPVFAVITRIGDLLLLSLLWFVTSLPLITIGASTTALFDICMKIVRSRDPSIIKDFFLSFKNNFRQATVIWLIMAAIGALGGVDMYFWAHSEMSIASVMNAVSIGIMVIFAATLLYVFPVQATFDNTVKATLRTAFLMSLKHFPDTVGLLICTAALSYLGWKIPAVGYVFFIIGTGLFAMLYSLRFVNIFKQYAPVIAEDMQGKAWDKEDSSEKAEDDR